MSEVCPYASQIADRFHLLMNLTDALDKYFKSITKEIRRVIHDKRVTRYFFRLRLWNAFNNLGRKTT
ncbi:MAG: hypothetical protein D4R64_18800 [Porphyromonadaceae bacterium]|nr:MAG: hypothetical protein D4R64_18800 [Porphyromonadaceae bacterium]